MKWSEWEKSREVTRDKLAYICKRIQLEYPITRANWTSRTVLESADQSAERYFEYLGGQYES